MSQVNECWLWLKDDLRMIKQTRRAGSLDLPVCCRLIWILEVQQNWLSSVCTGYSVNLVPHYITAVNQTIKSVRGTWGFYSAGDIFCLSVYTGVYSFYSISYLFLIIVFIFLYCYCFLKYYGPLFPLLWDIEVVLILILILSFKFLL